MQAELFSRQTTLTSQDNTIGGQAAVYWDGTPQTQYALADDYVVRFVPGSLDLEPTVFCYWGHDKSRLLAKTPDSLKVWHNANGLEFNATLPEGVSYAEDLRRLMQAGIVQGCSFGCFPAKHRMTREKGVDVRWFEKVNVFDISPTHDGAFAAATSALLDREAFHRHLVEVNQKRLAEILRRVAR